jgi:hypothetical protein
MSGFANANEQHGQLLRELADERFAALTRISSRLEKQIERLRTLRSSLTTLDGDARDQAVQAYRELRREAVRYRWYMDVQREVLGLRPHELVERFYKVPEPL